MKTRTRCLGFLCTQLAVNSRNSLDLAENKKRGGMERERERRKKEGGGREGGEREEGRRRPKNI